MSTIASPRDSSLNGYVIPTIATPTSSSRPSLDIPRSEASSPLPGATGSSQRRNRSALREYYNIKKAAEEGGGMGNDAASEVSSMADASEVQDSEMDRAGFDGEGYVRTALETQTLPELLRTYKTVLTEVRALDAEKKALVYDNYSKLIAATETIRRMRDNMDPLNPMAATLAPAVQAIYDKAAAWGHDLKRNMSPEQTRLLQMSDTERAQHASRARARAIVNRTLDVPEKLRRLVAADKEAEARKTWEPTLKLLLAWKERGVGGNDVQDCIDDGEAALRNEPPNEKSWVNLKKAEQPEA